VGGRLDDPRAMTAGSFERRSFARPLRSAPCTEAPLSARRVAVWLTFLCVLTSSCGGTYLSIAATPDRWVCPGTPITLSWAASRTPRITPTPAIGGLTALPNIGSRTVPLGATTSFLIQGGHWWWSSQTQTDAILYDPSLAQFPSTGDSQLQLAGVGTQVACSGDTAWVAFDQTTAHWDPRLLVGAVKARGGEKLSVWHAGIHAKLDSTPSDAFKTVPVEGIWLFETSCQPRPRVVGIELTATCAPKAP
jgi:hypothetical protein